MKRLYCAEATIVAYFVACDDADDYDLRRIGRDAIQHEVAMAGVDTDDVSVDELSTAKARTIDAGIDVHVHREMTVGDFLDQQDQEEEE